MEKSQIKKRLLGPKAKDITVDLLIMGSGTGMAAALAAHEKGLDCLVIEKTDLVGGSTALSGGAFWVPANRALLDGGSTDNLAKAKTYLDAVVGQDGNPARQAAFLKNGAAAIDMLSRCTTMKFFWAKGYSDYHPEKPGGDLLGRSCECKPFNISQLGAEGKRFRTSSMEAPVPMPVTGADYKWMNLMVRKPFKAFPRIFRRLAQGVGGLLIGRKYVAGGQAIAAGMFAGLIKADIPVWTETALIKLNIENNRVLSAVVSQRGEHYTITVRKGIIMAAGGFDHNLSKRQKYQSSYIVNDYSMGAEGNTGDTLKLVEGLDVKIGMMEEAWWFPAVAPLSEDETPMVLLAERSLPGSFIVDEQGNRFINEAMDYMSFGQVIRAKEKAGNPVKTMWMVFDQTYKNSYLLAAVVFPRMPLPDSWYKAGIAHQAENPTALAQAMGIPLGQLEATLLRFNELASKGVDSDFHRGESAYDHYYGDPTIKPNPNLRPLKGRLYAVKLVLSDLGTCGGVQTDENALVLREDGKAIQGLYAIGNNAANLFGRRYPGAGGTICQGLVFGYIAAQHAAAQANS